MLLGGNKMKQLISLLIIIILLFTLSGCVKHVEDTNGVDDFTIQTYTDADIESGKTSSTKFGSVETTINNNTHLKVSKFTGVEELLSTKATNQTLIYNVESTCKQGNFRIVILKDGSIIRDVRINSKETITLENCNGRYKLMMVGESAKIDIKYSVSK